MVNLDIDIQQFDYPLPDDKIAKYPLPERDKSKLLIYNNGRIIQEQFQNIAQHLPPNSLLVFNNTKVIAARLFFRKETGAQIEIFCLEPNNPSDFGQAFATHGHCQWNCWVGNLKKWKSGAICLDIEINGKKVSIQAKLIEKRETYNVVSFQWPNNYSFGEILDHAGKIPIPPYLNRESEDSDKKTYQTIFGKVDGSVAAPTAGLHFTENVLTSIDNKNIVREEVTLHVGAGTFKPVSSNSVQEHTMHSEFFTVSKTSLESLKMNLGNIIAVGTTTVRTLESLYVIGKQIVNGTKPNNHHFAVTQWEPYANTQPMHVEDSLDAILNYLTVNKLEQLSATTSIMIVPGYEHKLVKHLVTNFHQPRSTLLLLLASFVGNDWKKMYDFALGHDFRFLSYGDSCLILR